MITRDWLAFLLFAFVGSITPGPNNIIASSTGVNHGFRATLPHIFGVPCGFGSMLLISSIGVVSIALQHPMMQYIMRVFGITYLLYLAWIIGWPSGKRLTAHTALALPLSFIQSFLFQYANPKAWVLAIATAATFTNGIRTSSLDMLSIISIFSICAIISLSIWTVLGISLRSWLNQGQRLRWFNAMMGLSLVVSAILMLHT